MHQFIVDRLQLEYNQTKTQQNHINSLAQDSSELD